MILAGAVHADRRARVLAQMPPGAVAVLGTAPEVMRNGDSPYPYRHDSYFYYLSGFAEPDSVLVLVAALDARARGMATGSCIVYGCVLTLLLSQAVGLPGMLAGGVVGAAQTA